METYSVRLTEEIASLCELETIKLPGRQDGRAPSGVALLAFGIRQAAGTLARRKVDVAHMADMALWPLALLERLLGRASILVISAHGSDVSLATRAGFKATLYRWYLRLGAMLLKDVQVVANSSYIGGLAHDMGFTKVEVVPLGTDMTRAQAGTRSGLLFVGRIARSKGLRFLIEDVLPPA